DDDRLEPARGEISRERVALVQVEVEAVRAHAVAQEHRLPRGALPPREIAPERQLPSVLGLRPVQLVGRERQREPAERTRAQRERRERERRDRGERDDDPGPRHASSKTSTADSRPFTFAGPRAVAPVSPAAFTTSPDARICVANSLLSDSMRL